jgi:hypothetical protein
MGYIMFFFWPRRTAPETPPPHKSNTGCYVYEDRFHVTFI